MSHAIHLNDYQIANLRAALEAAGCGWREGHGVSRNPLFALNTGDWLGELYNLLPAVTYPPNAPPHEIQERAWAIAEESRPS